MVEPREEASARAGRGGQAREGEAARAHRGLEHGEVGGPRPVGDGGLAQVLSHRGGRHLRAQERRAEVSARAHRGGCHCQVGVQAHGGVCDALVRLKEVGEDARCIGSRGGMRAECCSRGWGMRAEGDKKVGGLASVWARARRQKGRRTLRSKMETAWNNTNRGWNCRRTAAPAKIRRLS